MQLESQIYIIDIHRYSKLTFQMASMDEPDRPWEPRIIDHLTGTKSRVRQANGETNFVTSDYLSLLFDIFHSSPEIRPGFGENDAPAEAQEVALEMGAGMK